MGYHIIPQKRFKGCKDKHTLPFDVYLKELHLLIEYQGEQHYKPIDFAGKGEMWAKQEFEKTIKRDNVKIEYCKNHNIPIIIIPYWKKNNMEDYILNKLKEIELSTNN
jgi:hypothetical protein